MNKYWVIWLYEANYSKLMELEASSAEKAVENVRVVMSADFREKATVLVFESPPVFVHPGDRAVREGAH